MAEKPTTAQVEKYRQDISNFVGDKAVSDYITLATAQTWRDMLNKRSIKRVWVWDTTNTIYFLDTDGVGNNEDQMHDMIILLTIAFIYQAWAQKTQDAQWWDLYTAYRTEYDNALSFAKLDVDKNESGEITADEEATTGQVFFTR